MALRNQLGEMYVKVIADVSSAITDSEKLLESHKKQTEGLKKQAEEARKIHEAAAKAAKLNIKDRDRILKDRKLEKVISKEQLKDLNKYISDREKAAKKGERLLDRHKVYNDLVQKHLANKLIRFRDFSGRVDEQEAATFNRYQQEKLANYESFLKRASSEHSRFVTRLDQRDMTASTLENMKRGFEKGVISGAKWHKDENQIQRMARGIGMAAGSLRKMKDDSEMAMAAFQQFQRVGYSLQAVFGAVAGSIGSLVGGLMGLVGVAGTAAYSLVALGSAFASMGAGMIAARIALGGVGQAVSAMLDPQKKLQGALRNTRRELRNLRFEAEEAALSEEEAAINLEKAREELARVQDLPPDSRVRRETELQFQQAELAYRRAKARNKDARDDLKRGPLGGSGVVDPLAKLTKSQKAFAKYLASLKPQMDELKEAAASGFLPLLQNAMENLVSKAMPTLKSGLNVLGDAMGRASETFSNAFTMPRNLELLNEFFISSRPFIEAFGRAAGNALGGLLGALKAAQPLTYRFVKWLDTLSVKFEMWGNSPGLKNFLNLAGDVAASLGEVFGSVFGGLKNLMNATFPGGDVEAGAGGVILRWLKGLADGFKAFTGSNTFADWLKRATTNATAALDSIGKLLSPIMDMASSPDLKKFWDTLAEAAPSISKVLTDGMQAAPEFAAMLVSVGRMFAAFSDTGALESFFNTLNRISSVIADFFELKGVKMFLDVIGRIHGVFLAIGLAIIVFKSVFMVLSGITKTVFLTVGKTAAVMDSMTARVYATATRFDTLKNSGLGAWGATKQLSAEIFAMNAAAIATRKESKMLQMAKDAGMAKKQVKELRDKIDEVIIAQQKLGFKGKFDSKFIMNEAVGMMGPPINPKTGKPYGKNTKTAQAYREDLQQRTQALVGGGGYEPKYGRNRLMTGARAVSGVAGAATMLGAFGSSTPSGFTQAMSGISAVTAMIPGPIGLLASAGTGIIAAVSSFKDAADAETARKKQEKLNIIAKEATIRVEKQKDVGAEALEYQKAGLKITDAVAAAVREGTQGAALAADYGLSSLKDAEGKDLGEEGATKAVAGFRTAFIDAGFGKEFAKDTKLSNKMLEAAASYSKFTGITDANQISEAILSIYKKDGLGGLETEIGRTKGKQIANIGGLGAFTSAQVTDAEGYRAAANKLITDGTYEISGRGVLQNYVNELKGYTPGTKITDSLSLQQTKGTLSASGASLGLPQDVIDKINNATTSTDLQNAVAGYFSSQDALLAAAKNQSATGVYNPLLGSAGLSPGQMNPTIPANDFRNFGTSGFQIPTLPGAMANTTSLAPAPTGPTGKAGDPLAVTVPEFSGLGPAITKLANATPSVVVVNVKNESELNALYRRLGLPAT